MPMRDENRRLASQRDEQAAARADAEAKCAEAEEQVARLTQIAVGEVPRTDVAVLVAMLGAALALAPFFLFVVFLLLVVALGVGWLVGRGEMDAPSKLIEGWQSAR